MCVWEVKKVHQEVQSIVVFLGPCCSASLCACVHAPVLVQDPGRATQQALGGWCQVNRARPSSARSGRHPRLHRLHHGVRRQRAPAGAQSGSGIAWHPWQVCPPSSPLSESSRSSSHLSVFSNLLISRCGTSVHTLKPCQEFLKGCFFIWTADF